jgi:uncharacterized membrane protein
VNWGVFAGAFAGSLIELVEILAVVLVVGRVAGWRNAFVGAGSAIGLVALVALLAGGSLTLMPLQPLEVVAGLILLAFGGWWALSVTKYYGGLARPGDDEEEKLARQLAEGGAGGGPAWRVGAMVVAFKSSLIESFEVAIIVLGLGLASGAWSESIGGMLFAAAGLVVFAVPLRGALQNVPVKPTKFFATALLLGFGAYWLGEGLGVAWPGGILSGVGLVVVAGGAMAAGAAILRSRSGGRAGGSASDKSPRVR